MAKTCRIGFALGALCLLCVSSLPGSAQTLDIEARGETKGSDNVAYFGFIKGMAEAGGGSVWIGDGINNALFRLNPDGTAQEMVAREGDGPGEVRGPVFLEATPSGGIAVYDVGVRD